MPGDMAAPAAGKRFRKRLRLELTLLAVAAVYRMLHATYRTRMPDPSYAQRRAAGENVRCIYAIWHSTLWHGLHAMRHQQIRGLVSSHRDGELAARVAKRFGYGLVRGSSSRGGARAMLELARVARETTDDFTITMDGPRGPAREVKEGILFAASRTGLPIVPVGLWVDRAWRTRSWDAHVIGKPLCRVAVVLGEEIRVPPGATREELLGTWAPAVVRGMEAAEARARAVVEAA